MVSIRAAVDDLERIHQMRLKALDCYLTAIRDIARYPVELDDSLTPGHRKALEELAEQVAAGDGETLEESRGMLRALLRGYRDKAGAYLASLKDELESTARALEEILDSLSKSDGEEEGRLKAALKSLREVSNHPAARPIRNAILNAANGIDQSLEQIRKQQQLTISQFHMEIRMLHQRIDALETAATIDSVTSLLKRPEMEQQIRAAAGVFSLVLVRVGGFVTAEKSFHPDVAIELAGAFTKRLRNSLPMEATVSRWSHEEFVAMLSVSKPEATPIARWIAEHLAGAYSLLLEGKLIHPRLQVSVATVEGGPGKADSVLERVAEFLTGK